MADTSPLGELKLTISPDDVRGFLQEALLKALSPAERDKLVAEAVRKLLSGTWQSSSDLQKVFSSAAYDVAKKLAEEEMIKPENQEKMRALVVDAWERLMGEKRIEAVAHAAGAIAQAMFGRNF